MKYHTKLMIFKFSLSAMLVKYCKVLGMTILLFCENFEGRFGEISIITNGYDFEITILFGHNIKQKAKY